MREAEEAKRQHQMFVAMRFVEAQCGVLAGELLHGEPPQADVLWHVNGRVVGIEITDGLFDDTDGRELHGSLRSRA